MAKTILEIFPNMLLFIKKQRTSESNLLSLL